MPLPLVGIALAGISGLVLTRAGAWIASALTAIGVGLAVQGAVFTAITAYANGAFGALPAEVAAWAGFLGLDKYVSLVVSGYAGAGLKRIIFRKLGA